MADFLWLNSVSDDKKMTLNMANFAVIGGLYNFLFVSVDKKLTQ